MKRSQTLVEATATALCEEARLGNVPGTIVSIVMPNCVPFILSFLAVPWSRSVSAPLNQNYTEAEYKFYMEDNKSKLLLVPDGDGIPAAEAAAAALGLSVYSVGYNLETGTRDCFSQGWFSCQSGYSSPEKEANV